MSCSEIAIEAKNLTKSYRLYARPIDRLRQLMSRGQKKYYKEFTALDGVSFEIDKGDSVGVLGHNGAGKSTLLQLVTGTLTPTSGDITTKGRIAALLELGAGFNPEFTGKENVYMNAAILGLSKAEIDEIYEDILNFAEIGDFIDRPVKTYSSGMYVRLAFSVAVHIVPEVLIVDEALAVGDIRFQMKCIKHMEELKGRGTTILFVSHSPEQVKRFCNKALWIEKGKIKSFGSSNDICNQYKESMSLSKKQSEKKERDNNTGLSSLPAKIISTTISKNSIKVGEPIEISIDYEIVDERLDDVLVGVAVYKANREYIFGANTYLDRFKIPSGKGIHTVTYAIRNMPLLPANFVFDVGLFTDKSLVNIDYITNAEEFEVYDDYNSEGLVHIDHEWL
ncbi:ABC transporter ATP-binding protein [Enterovibrio baiacu]|uniref:ABC transporter ATP-binding protein n=1 Tax=Enterovibrio baiacu TaxID=2491023 RepID=UPI00101092E4|nr:ABC transporter ATP-binding protein [Enterovibrio baiacu]MBE1274788.1 ABC transporter ATP-binding protein [Enterovibrio baiacu]